MNRSKMTTDFDTANEWIDTRESFQFLNTDSFSEILDIQFWKELCLECRGIIVFKDTRNVNGSGILKDVDLNDGMPDDFRKDFARAYWISDFEKQQIQLKGSVQDE